MEEKVKPSPTYKADLKAAQQKASKPLLWVGILSIVMLYAGLTSAYVVRADNGNWLLFNLPNAFYLSTAVIVTSSITLFFAFQMAKKNNQKGIIIGLLATFVHLFAGLISLLVTLKNSIQGKYNAQNTLGLELCSIYWHFLDILWVYLFLFLYYIR